MQMLAIGGFEILIGATALLSLLAVVAFFMGDKKERAATETSPGADEPEALGAVARAWMEEHPFGDPFQRAEGRR